ncbi:phage tail tape measure protein [Clostridioides difficile]|nr:phage tail tape measure protein [Clostridioides difficile]HBG1007117.1 phage tail tape measure protein [Clostridioides difficile]
MTQIYHFKVGGITMSNTNKKTAKICGWCGTTVYSYVDGKIAYCSKKCKKKREKNLETDRGLKGSEAGNSLNSIMINLTSGAGQAGVVMKELGLSAFDSNGKFKGVANILMELKEKTKDMTEEQRTMYLSMIDGKQISTLGVKK